MHRLYSHPSKNLPHRLHCLSPSSFERWSLAFVALSGHPAPVFLAERFYKNGVIESRSSKDARVSRRNPFTIPRFYPAAEGDQFQRD
jgi:hypothetical protein